MAPARVNFVQSGFWDGTSGTTFASPAISITTGNTIVACFGADTTAWSVTGIADTAGNTYVKAVNSSSNYREEIWVATNVVGHASNVVTATFSTAVSFRSVCVMQYSGVATASPVDATDYTTGPGTGAQTTGTLTGTATDAVHILTTRWGFGDSTYPSGFTLFTGSGGGLAEVADKVVTGGAFSGTYTLPTGHYYVLAVILKGVPGAAASARLSQLAVETLSLPVPAARVTQAVVEVLGAVGLAAAATARVSQLAVETLQPTPPAVSRLTQAALEAFVTTSARVHTTQVAVELFVPRRTPLRLTQQAVELFNTASARTLTTQIAVEVFRTVVPCTNGELPWEEAVWE